MHIFTPLILLFFALRMAWEDYQSRTIRVVDLLIFISLVLIWKQPPIYLILGCSATFLVCIFLQHLLQKRWGAHADILLLCLTPLLITLSALSLFFIILGGSLILYHLWMKEEKAPFITLYMMSLVLVMGIGH